MRILPASFIYFHVLRVKSQRSLGGLSFSIFLPIFPFFDDRFELKPDIGLKPRCKPAGSLVAVVAVEAVDVDGDGGGGDDGVAAVEATGVDVLAALIDVFEPENSDCNEAVGVINCCRLVRFLN